MSGHAARGRTAQSAVARLVVTLALSVALFATGCDEKLDAWPDARRESDVADTVDVVAPLCSAERPVPVDMLWVIDGSTSMTQERVLLADEIGRFTGALGAVGAVDLHTAVVTTTYAGEDGGRFWTTPASSFSTIAQESRPFPARSDLYCECAACAGWGEALAVQRCKDRGECDGVITLDGTYTDCLEDGGCVGDWWAARWKALLPGGNDLSLLYNANASINASCKLRCGDTSDPNGLCRDEFGSRWECQVPMGRPEDSGCLMVPDTTDCPEELTGVLPGVAAEGTPLTLEEHFRCIATVGEQRTILTNLEGGMAAAWKALAADGPFPDQICGPSGDVSAATDAVSRRATCSRQFLRPGALLVIVFVSDEDDCSVADGKRIVAEDFNRCALLGDEEMASYAYDYLPEQTGSTDYLPLAPPRVYAERLRSLLPEGSALFVAAISGDALGRDFMTDDELLTERLAFYGAMIDESNPLRLNSYICNGPSGPANLGFRYLQLTEHFGDNGFFGNLCHPDGMGAVLEDLGQAVAARLPCGVDDGEGAE